MDPNISLPNNKVAYVVTNTAVFVDAPLKLNCGLTPFCSLLGPKTFKGLAYNGGRIGRSTEVLYAEVIVTYKPSTPGAASLDQYKSNTFQIYFFWTSQCRVDDNLGETGPPTTEIFERLYTNADHISSIAFRNMDYEKNYEFVGKMTFECEKSRITTTRFDTYAKVSPSFTQFKRIPLNKTQFCRIDSDTDLAEQEYDGQLCASWLTTDFYGEDFFTIDVKFVYKDL